MDFTEFVQQIDWRPTRMVFGQSHHTLIGLVALSWVRSGNGRTVLDEPPQPEDKRGDLMLVLNGTVSIAVEVEGDDPLGALGKFRTHLQGSSCCETGFCILYSSMIRGRVPDRAFKFFDDAESFENDVQRITDKACAVSEACKGKPLFVVLLRKTYESEVDFLPQVARDAIAGGNERYRGRITDSRLLVFCDGHLSQERPWGLV